MTPDAEIDIIKASWAQRMGCSINQIKIPVSEITDDQGKLDQEKILNLIDAKHYEGHGSYGYGYHAGPGIRRLVELLMEERDEEISRLKQQLNEATS